VLVTSLGVYRISGIPGGALGKDVRGERCVGEAQGWAKRICGQHRHEDSRLAESGHETGLPEIGRRRLQAAELPCSLPTLALPCVYSTCGPPRSRRCCEACHVGILDFACC